MIHETDFTASVIRGQLNRQFSFYGKKREKSGFVTKPKHTLTKFNCSVVSHSIHHIFFPVLSNYFFFFCFSSQSRLF